MKEPSRGLRGATCVPGSIHRSALARALVLCVIACSVRSCVADESVSRALLGRAKEISEWIVGVRRGLHQVPEILFDLPKTSAYVRNTLDELGIKYRYPVARSGIVAEIGSGLPIVVLRADMDALPIEEETGFAFASRHPGFMHACGHDAHTAMLLGGARVLGMLSEEGALPQGTVRLVFQPAEEGGGGGKEMLDEGALSGAAAAFALHVWPDLPSGQVGTRVGPFLAGMVFFDIEISGAGAHAAMPHKSLDPVVAAASVVTALQTIVSRETDPMDAAVVSVTRHVAGAGTAQANNVIPSSVVVGGTLRAIRLATMARLRRRVEEVSAAAAAAHGCGTAVDWLEATSRPYPPLVNDAGAVATARRVAAGVVGAAAVLEVPQTMGGEDFAFFAEAVPAAFLVLGTRNATAGAIHPVHTSRFVLDEGVLPLGAALHASLATTFLREHTSDEIVARAEGMGVGGRGEEEEEEEEGEEEEEEGEEEEDEGKRKEEGKQEEGKQEQGDSLANAVDSTPTHEATLTPDEAATSAAIRDAPTEGAVVGAPEESTVNEEPLFTTARRGDVQDSVLADDETGDGASAPTSGEKYEL